jgi:hypothetical protein
MAIPLPDHAFLMPVRTLCVNTAHAAIVGAAFPEFNSCVAHVLLFRFGIFAIFSGNRRQS